MSNEIIVLKFGSSVLRTPDHLPDAVHEIYRHVRSGRRVIAVVSAYEGVTSRLLREAERFGPHPEPHALASWVATGERSAAAQLALALDQFGIPARLIDPRDLRLEAAGPPLDAEAVRLSVDATRALFDPAVVLVLPGYFASDTAERCMLLGRGGSDQSALFVAHALGADCVLVKDVHGIYDHDPAEAGPATHRYEHINWADAEGLAGKLIQPKALHFARERQYPFQVAAVAHAGGTRVGARTTPPTEISPRTAPLRIVLLGLGTVGLGVYRELLRRPDLFEVVRVVVRNKARRVAAGIDSAVLATDPLAAVAEPCDLVVELIGGNDAAGQAVETALAAGTPVVTANKALIATRGEYLESVASKARSMLRYCAAVGGAVPMIELVYQSVAGRLVSDPVVSLRGIVNGTCNFVLDQLERGASLADSVALAQASGFAEADPTSDLSGADAAAKLTILARILNGADSAMPVQFSGIDESTVLRVREAQSNGGRLRLVAALSHSPTGVEMRVGLEELPLGDWLAECSGEENGLEVCRASGHTLRMRGRGAGCAPTTTAVMADVYDLWRARTSN